MFSNPVFLTSLKYFFITYPIWLPFVLFAIFFEVWRRMVQTEFGIKQGGVLLEFKLPREITKSPHSMELLLASLWQTGSASYFETFIDGKIRPWFSFELVSIEGEVHFYAWVQKKWKSVVETQVYGQYPEVEVHEVEDYAAPFKYDSSTHAMWGTNFKLKEPAAYPIKTYPDFGLDKDPKEEFKIEPMTPSLEFLGSLGKGQQVWVQILFQAHKKTGLKEAEPHLELLWDRIKDFFTGKGSFWDIIELTDEDWKADAREEINKINAKLKDPNNPDGPSRRPTKGEADTIAAIERSLAKLPFETMIRGFYIAEAGLFDTSNLAGLIGFFRQYNSPESNGFSLGKFTDWGDNGKDFFRFFFTKLGRRLRDDKERELLKAYRLRSYFNYPFKHYLEKKPFILTTEELATLYHFPGKVAATPTLERIPSKKAEAPPNLPI